MSTSLKAKKPKGVFFVPRTGDKSPTRLHELMIEAKRIRLAHTKGQLTAEEAAEMLAELHNNHRFKRQSRGSSLLSA